MRQTRLYHLLCQSLMLGHETLDKCHATAEHGNVTTQYAADKFVTRRHRLASRPFLKIRINLWRLRYSGIDRKSGIGRIVLGMKGYGVGAVMSMVMAGGGLVSLARRAIKVCHEAVYQ